MDLERVETSLDLYLASVDARPNEFRSRERRALFAVNEKARSAASLAELMDLVFDETKTISPTDRMSVLLLEESGTRVVSHWVKATYAPVLLPPEYQQDLHTTSLEEVLRSGKPRVIQDLEVYLSEHPQSVTTQLLVNEGIRSSLAWPLASGDRRIGVLLRDSREHYAYGHHQLRLHEVLMRILGPAVLRAYQMEELTAANRAYMEMLGFVSHELKSPLASITMDAKLLTEGYIGQLSEKQHERVEKIIAKADYLLSLVREYLDLARIEGGELRVTPRSGVDFLAEVIEPSIELAIGQLNQRGMRIVRMLPKPPPLLDCDPDMLRIALFNLLGNAAKYGRPGGNVRLSVVVKDGAFEVSVFNDGVGFPPSEKHKLFRRFSRLQVPELRKEKGTGVGLYTVWRIVQQHGGRTYAESQQGQWADFGFVIPQPLSCRFADWPGGAMSNG